MWSDLAEPWQICLEEAWSAYCAGSFPIGAVVVDADGKILSRGRNHIRDTDDSSDTVVKNQLAHAELNALLKVSSLPKRVLHDAALYTMLEPCPLCMGALYMSSVRKVYYAARDVYGGSTDLLGKTAYLSVKPIQIFPPRDAELETMALAIYLGHTTQEQWEGSEALFAKEKDNHPDAYNYGVLLNKENWLQRMREKSLTAKEMYDNLLFQYHDFTKNG